MCEAVVQMGYYETKLPFNGLEDLRLLEGMLVNYLQKYCDYYYYW